MKKTITLILALILTLCICCAQAEDFVMAGVDGDSTVAWEDKKFFQRMEEATGVHFVMKQETDADNWHAHLNEMMHSDDLPDILFKAELTAEETETLYQEGKLIDLKPLLAENAPNLAALLDSHPEWEQAITMPDGAIVTLPCINLLMNNNAMWINTTWLNELGLNMPTTADELTEVLRAFAGRDPNMNGKKDEIPLTFIGMWDLRWLGHAFGLNMNDYYLTADESGKVRTDLLTEENRAFLSWLRQLWQERLLDHSGFTTTDTLKSQSKDEKTALYGILMGPNPLTLLANSQLDQYSVLTPLTCDGKQVYRMLQSEAVRGTFAITSHCAEPEKMLAWVDRLYTTEGSILMQCGVEGTEYSWNEEGHWEWLSDAATVAQVVMDESTINQGGTPPGYMDDDFQLKFEDEQTRKMVEELYQLKQVSVLPVPQIWLSREGKEKIAALQQKIGPYAEETMASFVNGDLELTDETWAAFGEKLKELGMEELVSLWQQELDRAAAQK